MLPGEEFYLEAFWSLSTERQVGQALGRIPWSRAMLYAVKEGVEPDMLGPFWRILYEMDTGYLEHQRNEHDKVVAQQTRGARRRARSKSR